MVRAQFKIFAWITFLAILVCAADRAFADFWVGFYTSDRPAKQDISPAPIKADATETTETTGAQCIAAILQAEQKHGIPQHLLLTIGIQEAGRTGPAGLAVWPWTVNANGQGAFFKTRADAEAWVREKQAEGINSIDVGCMQVNLRWHGENFSTQDSAFDPYLNADYAARFLKDLYRQTGTWELAAGRYHSATDIHQKRYLNGLERNRQVVMADLDRLLALAKRADPQTVALAELKSEPPVVPAPPVFWAASKDGASYSIYSNAALQPMLPAYREMF